MIKRFPCCLTDACYCVSLIDKEIRLLFNRHMLLCFQPAEPATDADKIQDEVKRQCNKCTCVRQFKIHKIGEGKYRVGVGTEPLGGGELILDIFWHGNIWR